MPAQQQNDQYASLTGTNQFEMLLFRLGKSAISGKSELFGINVLKIREILTMPDITSVAGGGEYSLGVAHLRGEMVPVYDLPGVVRCKPEQPPKLLLITEFSSSTQAFTVESVEDIAKLDWNQISSTEASGVDRELVTSIARITNDEEDGSQAFQTQKDSSPEDKKETLVQVLDVESILEKITPKEHQAVVDKSGIAGGLAIQAGTTVLAADDSFVARALMSQVLEGLNVPFEMTKTGLEAWKRLNALAEEAENEGKTVYDKVGLILSDLEMPEMDGFTLTRMVKEDPRFSKIPVVIHSSLSGTANENHAASVGADGFVSKFSPEELIATLKRIAKEKAVQAQSE